MAVFTNIGNALHVQINNDDVISDFARANDDMTSRRVVMEDDVSRRLRSTFNLQTTPYCFLELPNHALQNDTT